MNWFELAKQFFAEDFEEAMRHAISLAKKGPSNDENPRVGCVIVDENLRLVASGMHLGKGTDHAEVAALKNLSGAAKNNAGSLTAVVTLEPCNHEGTTGPCVDALLKAGIGRVVYGSTDTGAESRGGADRLRASGVETVGGVLRDKTDELVASWREKHSGLPKITVKWAQTIDGYSAAADGTSKWITGPLARRDVHERRAAHDAILVGTGTLLADDPELTARAADGSLLVSAAEQPVPVVLGKREVPGSAKINEHPALAAKGLRAPIKLAGDDLVADLALLKELGITSLYVEGGPTVVGSFLKARLVDEIHVYVAPTMLGDGKKASADLGIGTLTEALHLLRKEFLEVGPDLLFIFGVKNEAVEAANASEEN